MSLCIVAPCKDASAGPARTSFARLAGAYGARTGTEAAIVDSWQCSNVARVRRELAERALLEPSTEFLWLDDDTVAKRSDLFALLEVLYSCPEVDVVSGCYQQKKIDGQLVGSPLEPTVRSGALIGMSLIGLGFALMRRHVLEAIVQDDRAFECRKEHWWVGGEDETFCRWWRARGGKLWAHPDIQLGHVGMHVFGGSQ